MSITVGKKISLGFSVIVIMLIGLGCFSFYSSQFAQKGLSSFKTMSLTGRVQANILMMRLHALKFFGSGDKKAIESFWQRSKKVDTFLGGALKSVKGEQRLEYLQSIKTSLKDYRSKFRDIETMYTDREVLVNGENGVNSLGPQIEKNFSKIMASAFKDKDPTAAYYTAEALRVLLIARLRVLKYLDNNDPNTGKQVSLYLSQLKEKTVIMDREIQNPGRRKLMGKGIALANQYEETFKKIVRLITNRNKLIADMGVLGKEFATKIEDIKLSIKADQDKLAPSMDKTLENSKLLAIITSILAVFLGVGIAVWLVRSVNRVLREIAAGLKQSSQQVENASNKMLKASTTLQTGVSEQASSIQETSASLEEISRMVESNVANSEQAAKLSESMKDESHKGNQTMQQLKDSMKNILDSNEKIEEFVNVVSNIQSKTKVMNEIAFQTKLLSLNASIEAEKAGSHGRGFAVVAEEVGNLAQLSSKAAQEISAIIKESLNEVKLITSENKTNVERGHEYLASTADILESILNSSSSVAEGSNEVSSASKDQSIGVRQINNSVQNLNQKVQETANTADETKRTSESLGGQVDYLKKAVEKLTELVDGKPKQENVSKDSSKNDSHHSDKKNDESPIAA